MSKPVTIQLSETEFRELMLCYTLGSFVKSSVEEESEPEIIAAMELHQKLDKAAYEAKLKGSGYEQGIYYYGKDIEEEMLDIYDDFKEYISSGQEEQDTEALFMQIAAIEKEQQKNNINQVYQLKIVLQDTQPQIWRRIQLSADSTFLELHMAVQLAMGWKCSHMFEFMLNDLRIGLEDEFDDMGDEKLDADEETLCDFISETGQSFTYLYDFGDDWEHEITLEKILTEQPGVKHPVCIDGAMACPPEDSGGVHGFYEKLEAIKNPQDKEEEYLKEWMGANYNPEVFNPEAANKKLLQIKKYLKKIYEE